MMKSLVCFSTTRPSGLPRWLFAILSLGILIAACGFPASAQVNVLTQHNTNFRTGLNDSEAILTPANVNAATFGPIFSLPVDGKISAQPLYMSGVNIPGRGTHNVVYVVTLHDSVYAFDADGLSSTPLWQVNFLNPAAGIITETPAELGCATTTANTEMGILGTPVIDSGTQTMYVLAKTKENGTFHFRLHALDTTTGMEKLGGPLDLSASVTGKIGTLMFSTAAKNMMARPGMLLSQGIVYMAFGSNGCDGGGTRGWVLAYDASTLLQLGVFNDTPDNKTAQGNIWMAGNGLASNDAGDIFFSTANGPFDANLGSNDYGSSILKIGWTNGSLVEHDYFTPYNQAALAAQDLDVGSAGVTMLPDQPGTFPHLIIGSGKAGDVYVMNRDNLGQYNPVDNSQIVSYLPATDPSGVGRMFSTAAYWNGNVYFTGQNQGVSQYSITNGQLTLLGRNASVLCCPHTPSISSNENTNGILWIANQNGFSAINAADVTQPTLFSNQKLGVLAHFNTPTIANGRVYVGADMVLQVLGLLGNLQATSGSGQTAPSLGTLAQPLQVTATNPYTGAPVPGVTVTFLDNGKGMFSPNLGVVVTDASGRASVTYRVPQIAGTYTITAAYTLSTTAKFTVNVVGGTATHVIVVSGKNQTGALNTTLAQPLVFQLADAANNGVSGGMITFSANPNSGTFSPMQAVSDSKGKVQTFYTAGTKSGSITVSATYGSFHGAMSETIMPGPAVAVNSLSGNNQKAPAGTALKAQLGVAVVDQYGNGIPGLLVTFNDGGANGTLSASQVTTDVRGRAIVSYTLPATAQVVHIIASSAGVGSFTFTETAQ